MEQATATNASTQSVRSQEPVKEIIETVKAPVEQECDAQHVGHSNVIVETDAEPTIKPKRKQSKKQLERLVVARKERVKKEKVKKEAVAELKKITDAGFEIDDLIETKKKKLEKREKKVKEALAEKKISKKKKKVEFEDSERIPENPEDSESFALVRRGSSSLEKQEESKQIPKKRVPFQRTYGIRPDYNQSLFFI
jgi:hypothetical protein